MKLPLWQIDAFASELFGGNPAAVVLLERWLPDATMQSVALENNLSETAFLVPDEEAWKLRWFTPEAEVDLCGHATLASAHVLFAEGRERGDVARFDTRSGRLNARRLGDRIELDLPSQAPTPVPPGQAVNAAVADALGARPDELWRNDTLFAIFSTEADVAALRPDMSRLAELPGHNLVATAPGDQCDFVSRYFAPAFGIDEDPATGSAHCLLTPYWSARLGKPSLFARQLSARGAELWCEDRGERVAVSGRTVLYMKAEIEI